MKQLLPWLLTVLITCLASLDSLAEAPLARDERNFSIRNEVETALEKSVAFLVQQQLASGTWRVGEENALRVNSMVLLALDRHRRVHGTKEKATAAFQLALPSLREMASSSGCDCRNTPSVCIILGASQEKIDQELLIYKRACLASSQIHQKKSPLWGGLSCLGGRDVAPLEDFIFAATVVLSAEPPLPGWDPAAARAYIERCRRPPTDAATRSKKVGVGFASFPSASPKHPGTKPTLAATAAALNLLLGSGDATSPTAAGALTWLFSHYTLDLPELNESDRARYFLHFSTVLHDLGSSIFVDGKGRTVDGAHELAERLVNEQAGSGAYGSGDQAVETTAWTILALEQVFELL